MRKERKQMPPFEGPKSKKSIGERAAAQNKKAAEEQSKTILQGLIAGINKKYKNDPEMRKQKLKELRADRKEQSEKELKKQQSEYDEFLDYLKSLPAVPRKVDPLDDRMLELPKANARELMRKRFLRPKDPQNMAPRMQKDPTGKRVLTRGAARGGKIKKSYARGGGIRKPKY